ncbi:MAG TPA: response regulator transcription factor [Streptosporangiaceae bacterium]|nr:response regulator transcription factor [Streptosporangiaceae bacterium]
MGVDTLPGTARIVIVDDHTIVRQGLRSILELEPGFRVVGEASGVSEAVAVAGRLRPDVMVLDLKLNGGDPAEGLDLCDMLHRRYPAIRIVVLTTFLDRRLLLGALQRGASAYVLKDVDVAELARIIRAVRRGESGFDGRSAQLVVRSLTEPDEGNRLTPRELDVVRYVTSGATNPQIARDLYVSESTVKQYVRAAMRKLGARDRTELAYRAGKLGVV